MVSIDPEEKESLQFCGFLCSVYCILVTHGLHRKNKINNHANSPSFSTANDYRADGFPFPLGGDNGATHGNS